VSWLVRELTSPRLDWPRVGLSANCPVSVSRPTCLWHKNRKKNNCNDMQFGKKSRRCRNTCWKRTFCCSAAVHCIILKMHNLTAKFLRWGVALAYTSGYRERCPTLFCSSAVIGPSLNNLSQHNWQLNCITDHGRRHAKIFAWAKSAAFSTQDNK